MRIAKWRADKVFSEITDAALAQGNAVMDSVASSAVSKCRGFAYKWKERPGGWSGADVAFIPKTGPNKDKLVAFRTEKRWTGRQYGDLARTIRRVNKEEKPGNIRTYAGNFKIYYAFMVERGTSSTGWGGPAVAQPFLRPAFNEIRSKVTPNIQKAVNEAATKAMR
jgi:hypothetical protein